MAISVWLLPLAWDGRALCYIMAQIAPQFHFVIGDFGVVLPPRDRHGVSLALEANPNYVQAR
jgi:hypothetical protein